MGGKEAEGSCSNIGMVLNLLCVCHLPNASCKLILNISSDLKGYLLNISVAFMIKKVFNDSTNGLHTMTPILHVNPI